MKIVSTRTLILAVLAMMAGIGVLAVPSITAWAQDPNPKSIKRQDLPKNAVVSFDGYISDLTDISHPLNKAEAPDSVYTKLKKSPDLYDYSSVHMFSSVLQDQHAYVANWLYVYKNPGQAKRAADTFVQELLRQAPDKVDHYKGTSKNKALTGDVLSIFNPQEGVEIVWYVATDENILSLVMVDGLDSATNQEVLRSVLELQRN